MRTFRRPAIVLGLLSLALAPSARATCAGIESCEPSLDDARAKIEQLLGAAYVTPPRIVSLERFEGRSVETTQGRKTYEMRIFAVMSYAGGKLQCRINLCPQLGNHLVQVNEAAKKATIAGWLFFEPTDQGWR